MIVLSQGVTLVVYYCDGAEQVLPGQSRGDAGLQFIAFAGGSARYRMSLRSPTTNQIHTRLVVFTLSSLQLNNTN